MTIRNPIDHQKSRERERDRMKIQCDVCSKEEASVFCSADEAALCVGCDRRVHHANKLASKHIRFSLQLPSSSSSSDESPRCDICQVLYLWAMLETQLPNTPTSYCRTIAFRAAWCTSGRIYPTTSNIIVSESRVPKLFAIIFCYKQPHTFILQHLRLLLKFFIHIWVKKSG